MRTAVTSTGRRTTCCLAYFVEFPDYLTQGETLSELEENLRDLYQDLTSGDDPRHPQSS